MMTIKRNSRYPEKKRLWLEKSYLSTQSKPLRGCTSVAHFFSSSKGKNASFQLFQRNGQEFSFSKLLLKSPSVAKQNRRIRVSKSCGKNCGLVPNSYDIHQQFDSLCGPDRTLMCSSSTKGRRLIDFPRQSKLIFSKKVSTNSKKSVDVTSNNKKLFIGIRDSPTSFSKYQVSPNTVNGKTKNKSENQAFRTMCKIYHSSNPLRRNANAKLISRNRSALSKEAGHSHKKWADIEAGSELDSAVIDTDKTTAHTTKQDQIRYRQFAKTLNTNLTKMLQEIDKTPSSETEKYNKRIKAAKEKMEEACAIFPHFKELLKRVVSIVEEQGEEQIVILKRESDRKISNYKEEISIIQQKLLKQEELFKQQSKEHQEILNQKEAIIEKQKLAIFEIKKQLTQCFIEPYSLSNSNKLPCRMQELTEEVQLLNKENKRLGLIAKKIFCYLQNSKKREASLIAKLKGETLIEQKQLNSKIIEVGKRKVKIPTLDLSKLPKRKPAKLRIIDCPREIEESKSKVIIVDEEALSEGEIAGELLQSNESSESIDSMLENFLQQMEEDSHSVCSEIKTC